MLDPHAFAELLTQVRAGDEKAATILFRQFEPEIRRLVRLRLRDRRLRRVFDSTDICQSVMAAFFTRAKAGEFQLDEPEQLVRLLATMAQHRLISHVRREQAGCRDIRRLDPTGLQELIKADDVTDPSQIVARRDVLAQIRARLSPEECQVADRWAEGQTWPAVAAELGGTPDGRRVQLGRALARVARELDLHADG